MARRGSTAPAPKMKLSSLGLSDLRVSVLVLAMSVCRDPSLAWFHSEQRAQQVDGVPSLAELISREGPMFKIVVEGQAFGKLMENGAFKSEYVLRFEPSCHILQAGKKQRIDVCRLKEVRLGFLTQTFLSFAEKHGLREECCFSVVYEREGGQLPHILNLTAPSNERRDMWAHAFRLLIQTLSAMNAECYSLMAPWIGALKKGQDCLGIKETVALLDSLHIGVDNVREQQKDFKVREKEERSRLVSG